MKRLTLTEFRKAAAAGSQHAPPDTLVTLQFGVRATQPDGEDDSRILQFVASDETLDRYGDVVLAEGWQLEQFKRNPVILWQHNHDLLPVGKANDIGVRDKALVGAVEFAPAAINPFAEQVYQAYKAGYLAAVSVGFMALEWKWTNPDDPNSWGITFSKQELLEFSCVTIPANPNALVTGERSAPQPRNAPASVYLSLIQTRRKGS